MFCYQSYAYTRITMFYCRCSTYASVTNYNPTHHSKNLPCFTWSPCFRAHVVYTFIYIYISVNSRNSSYNSQKRNAIFHFCPKPFMSQHIFISKKLTFSQHLDFTGQLYSLNIISLIHHSTLRDKL